ncbi:MAG: hypothetical protein HN353_01705 [Bdellovibrionales bacterium]|nr:hypothetical protein [Bdellovibrionales bacterium]MBT3525404.1 hypothetical protein [Bdellovibrionales bacterium]MBT7668224.1 hypothetical protein [Bdellovibrionales bacterium]MBT7767176.1 hypothetical protein [Bdellovibrionales bacterium]
MDESFQNVIKKKREELDDDSFENLLILLSHYVFGEVEGIVSFDDKTPKQREELAKVVSKCMETTSVIMFELIPNGTIDREKLKDVVGLLKRENFKDAHKLLCGTGDKS